MKSFFDALSDIFTTPVSNKENLGRLAEGLSPEDKKNYLNELRKDQHTENQTKTILGTITLASVGLGAAYMYSSSRSENNNESLSSAELCCGR